MSANPQSPQEVRRFDLRSSASRSKSANHPLRGFVCGLVSDENGLNTQQVRKSGVIRKQAHRGGPACLRIDHPGGATMNQNGFPPVYCRDCEMDLMTWEDRMRAWRKANPGRGRFDKAGQPEKPRGCKIDVLAPCCHEGVDCGTKHGHPTDEEEQELHDKFDRLIWGPPDEFHGRGTIYRGLPGGECAACEELATKWIGKNRPVCSDCYAELSEIMARCRAVS